MERCDSHFVTFDGTSRGERGHGPDRRERGEGRALAHSEEMGRGTVCGYVVIQLFSAVRLCFEVQDGRSG